MRAEGGCVRWCGDAKVVAERMLGQVRGREELWIVSRRDDRRVVRELFYTHCTVSPNISLSSPLSTQLSDQRTDVVVVAVAQYDDVAHLSSRIQRPSRVIADRDALDELAQAGELNVRILRLAATSCVEEEDRVRCRDDLGIDERLFVVDVVDLNDKECRVGETARVECGAPAAGSV